jgi:hypothetical protein
MSLVVWDWDDTLLCSTFIQINNLYNIKINEELQKQFYYLSLSIIRVLKKSYEKSNVIIVTNSDKGWVEFSCKKFMPILWYNFLYKVSIISAKSRYADVNHNGCMLCMSKIDPQRWKEAIFLDLLPKYSNVIGFGDANTDRLALRKMFLEKHVKTVLFSSKPTLNQILIQLNFLYSVFDHIVDHKDKLDLKMSIK